MGQPQAEAHEVKRKTLERSLSGHAPITPRQTPLDPSRILRPVEFVAKVGRR